MYGFLNSKFDNILNLLAWIDADKYSLATYKSVTFQVTNDCNLQCSYCYQHCKNQKVLDFDTAKKFIDDLFANRYKEYLDIDNINFLVFDFIGGEPFLCVDLMSQIIDYIEFKLLSMNSSLKYNHLYSITSNGTLYRDERVQAFMKKYDGLIDISITVDGNKEVHDSCRIFPDGSGSYDLAHDAQLDIKNKYKQKGTKITLAPSNLPHLAESFIDIYNDGFHSINMNCVYEDVWQNIEDIRELYRQGIKIVDWMFDNKIDDVTCSFIDVHYGPISENSPNWCGGTGSMLSISPNGNIYPCQRYSEISTDVNKVRPYILGDTVNGILTKESERNVIKDLNNVTAWTCSDEECRKCLIASSCSYCSAFNYETFGTVNKRTKFHCDTHKVQYLISYYCFYRRRVINKDAVDIFSDMSIDLLLSNNEIIRLIGEDGLNKYLEMSEYLKGLNLKQQEFKEVILERGIKYGTDC